MNIGRFTVEQLSEGHFEFFPDGSFQKVEQESYRAADGGKGEYAKTFTLGIDPILVSTDQHHLLLDTGLGWGLDAGSDYPHASNVKTNLGIFGLQPEDITHVILTHLHYDHSAGASFTDGEVRTRATFPNARIYLQRREWEYALQYGEQKSLSGEAGYRLDEFYRLVADDRIVFLENDFHEPVSGVRLLWTGGHTPGHQVVRISDGGETAYYLGDLLPSDEHLNHYAMRHLDVHPLQAKKMKVQLLRRACEERACLLFYHSLYSRHGVLVQDKNRNYALREKSG